MIPAPAFPVSGPAGDHHVKTLLISGKLMAKTVLIPMTTQPMLEAKIAEAAAPVFFLNLFFCLFIYSPLMYWSDFGDKSPEKSGDTGEDKC